MCWRAAQVDKATCISYNEKSAFRLIGVLGQGSIPWALFFFMVLPLFLLRYIGNVLVDDKYGKGVSMVKYFDNHVCFLLSAIFETVWTIGINSAVGHLSP